MSDLKIIETPSPNHGARADGKAVSFLILHYTNVPEAKDALDILLNPEKQVSAHYLVDTDGTIHRMVPEDRRAWHAGKSLWGEEEDINSCSIGIEIQNPGHGCGYISFPDIQIDAVTALCQEIISRHNILSHNILAHSDIAPERKSDPGELFPWQILASKGIGLWVDVRKAHSVPIEDDIKPLLVEYGYDPRCDLRVLVTAFQRHFEPEVFKVPSRIGAVNSNTLHVLRSLLKMV